MDRQNGGLKLKNSSKKGFQPIIDMINSSSSNLSLLTYKSLKGFMIILDVSEENSEYFGLNNRFTKPITSYILKFAAITTNNDENLPLFKGIEKSSESKNSFYNEAKLQQEIWKKSIIGSRPEICPPVANFVLFDRNNSKELCDFFQKKTNNNDVKDIFAYFDNIINNINGLGVIVMPNIVNSTTFSDFISLSSGTNFNGIIIDTNTINEAFANISAQIIRLFVVCGVIHFDLHGGNSLIFVNSSNKISCIIIDFGRASSFLNEIDDDYLTVTEKNNLRNMQNIYIEHFFISYDNSKKEKYVIDLLDFIANEDKIKNQLLFSYTDPNSYQMDWYNLYPKISSVLLMTFDIFKSQFVIEDTKTTSNTIKKYEKQGYLLSFERPVDSFFYNLNGNLNVNTFSTSGLPGQVQKCNNVSNGSNNSNSSNLSNGLDLNDCVISGGKHKIKNITKKYKKKQYKKNRKTKKNKKTKKKN